ncbi:MAG: glycine zipper 2TM domain-containing protein [Syntrophobacterales bacterium]|nr:glycine zipper 2TM domain-containing protein [Syntrophobacterales bacterium]
MVSWRKAVILGIIAGWLWGCSGTHPYTYTGAALGGGMGALTGAAVDHNNRWRGAAIGGLMGGVLGGVAGELARQNQAYQGGGYYGGQRYGYQYYQDPYASYEGDSCPPSGFQAARPPVQRPYYQY